MEIKSGIYCWHNLVTNKSYIGQTKNLLQRYKAFIRWNNKNYAGKDTLINETREQYSDMQYWEYKVLEYCDETLLDEREGYWIATLGTSDPNKGYNVSIGTKHSQATKDKMSDSRKGEKCYWFGKHHSDETKEKLRIGHTGEKNVRWGTHHTEKAKRKIADAQRGEKSHHWGKHPTEETRQKLCESHKGENHWAYGTTLPDEYKEKISKTIAEKMPNVRRVRQIDKEIGEVIKIWVNASQAARALNIRVGAISAVCLKKKHCKTAAGFVWEYEDNGTGWSGRIPPKPVCQLTTDGELIKIWPSLNVACKAAHTTLPSINQVCEGTRITAGGFKWRYATPDEIASLNNS